MLHLRRFRATAFETSLDDFLFSNALRDTLWVGFGTLWQIFERGQNALQFRVEILVLVFGKILQRNIQDIAICARRDRQSALAVEQIKGALLIKHLQLTALEDAPILVAQDWQQNFVTQIRF